MYQVWITEDGARRPGPRFRSLEDALRHVRSDTEMRSFAIQTPDGQWHRNTAGGTTFGGRRKKTKYNTLARGSGAVDVSAYRGRIEFLNPEDERDHGERDGTDVNWPPEDLTISTRKIFG